VKGEIVETENVFQKTHQALEERGEKLKVLDKKTANLAQSSRNFADLAREVRKKQEKKKWYQL